MGHALFGLAGDRGRDSNEWDAINWFLTPFPSDQGRMTSVADMESIENRGDVLRLEYACTPAERKEAESFVLAQTLGGGSKRRANAKLLLILIAFICLFVLFVVTVIPKAFAPYMIAGWVGLTVVVTVLRRRTRRRLDKKLETSPPITVELSAHGIRIDDKAAESQVMMPWDSFRRRFESESVFVFQHGTGGLIFMIPKRALPSPESIEWLREVNIGIATRDDPESPLPLTPAPASRAREGNFSDVTLEYRMGYWNCVDLSFASWGSGRGAAVFMIGMFTGMSIYSAFAMPHRPNAKFSDLEVYCYFIAPMMLIGSILMAFVLATQFWLSRRGQFKRRTVRLSETSLTLSENDGTSEVPWSRFARYKETPWSFLAWKGQHDWLLLPKSVFPSIPAQERCRELFARHLKRSTWFFGN